MLSIFAASEGIPLAAEPVFHVGGLAVTNSMIYGVITGIIVIAIFMYATRRTQLRPKSLFTFTIETIVEFFLGIAQDNFGSRPKALKHLPLLLTLFSFILV